MADHSSIDASHSIAATSSASSCSVCAQRNESRTSDAIGYSASPFKDVMRSAESGCPICNSVLEGVRLWGVTEHPNYADGEIQWMNTARSVPGPLHVKVKSNPEVRGSDSFSVDLILYTQGDQYDDRSIFGSARSVPRNSSSDETFALIKEWLDTCMRNHPLCNKPRHTEKAARLVYIGQDPGNTAIKLIAFPATDVSYVALSYCWGSSLPLKTEKSSLEARMNGISWSRLPKTFQDAMTIARKLGYRYLWIDSLCIVQDDQQDWERESAKMGNIFESAAVTLSAAFGADSNAGCFHDRHHWSPTTVQRGCIFDRPTLLGEDRVSFIHQVSDDLSQTVYVERCPEHECLDHRLRFSSAELSPIFNRAWTMQERLLSPRVLQFTRTELCWECHTLVDCECGYADRHIWLRRQDLGRDYLKVFSQAEGPDISHLSLDDVGHPIPRGRTEPSRYYDTSDWMDIVREYNQRKLTKATDKLPAFSAIAKRMMRPQYGAYCAGLWEAHLPVALLWNQLSHHNGTDTKLPRKVLPYRAPSWSWASVNGDVIFIGGNMISGEGEICVDALVKEVSCPPMGLDPTGQVSGGHILLEAPIVRFRWESAGDNYQPWNSSSWKVRVGIDGADNGVAWADFHHDISKQSLVDLEGTDALLFASERTCCELRELEIPGDLALIIISSYYHPSTDNYDTKSRKLEKARGLQGLLVKESSAKPGSYERVGYYLPEYNRCEVGSLAQIAEIRLI